jgi:protein-ribulosamine 3-kinase
MDLASICKSVLSSSKACDPAASLELVPLGGGDINDSYQVLTDNNQSWFCKFNDANDFPGLFAKESSGLSLLGQPEIIRVPAVIACGTAGGKQVLVLEWIGPGERTRGFWSLFGEQLARLHRTTRLAFGLDEDNYIGPLNQDNTSSTDWAGFFRHRRLEPQIRLAMGKGLLDAAILRHFDGLYRRLGDIFPSEPACLLHGDLWNGNFLCDGKSRPVLIDPACYYGHRSMDLAMTALFGGFEKPFYDAYAYYYPFPSNYKVQWEICNLYPQLVHLNLFGKSYLGNILNTIQRF